MSESKYSSFLFGKLLTMAFQKGIKFKAKPNQSEADKKSELIALLEESDKRKEEAVFEEVSEVEEEIEEEPIKGSEKELVEEESSETIEESEENIEEEPVVEEQTMKNVKEKVKPIKPVVAAKPTVKSSKPVAKPVVAKPTVKSSKPVAKPVVAKVKKQVSEVEKETTNSSSTEVKKKKIKAGRGRKPLDRKKLYEASGNPFYPESAGAILFELMKKKLSKKEMAEKALVVFEKKQIKCNNIGGRIDRLVNSINSGETGIKMKVSKNEKGKFIIS